MNDNILRTLNMRERKIQGNCRQLSLTSILGKRIEELIEDLEN